MAIGSLFSRSCALAAAVALTIGGPAQSYVLQGGAQTPLWDAGHDALVETGALGLGGGIEVSVHWGVCSLEFLDPIRPSCAQVRAQVIEAANRWSEGHADIKFVDVSTQVDVEPAPRQGSWRGHGAEVDVYLASAATFLADHGGLAVADARLYYDIRKKPRRTSGGRDYRALGSITSADMRLNAGACFYFDTAYARPDCSHFASVVQHEFGHVLGLGHASGVGHAHGEECDHQNQRRPVMHAEVAGHEGWTRGLTADDLAGRDVLYPSVARFASTRARATGS